MRLGYLLTTRSLENDSTPTVEISQQATHPAEAARDVSYVPTPTTTDQFPSQTNGSQLNNTQTNNGLDAATKIGLESGITLGILVVIVAIGLYVYGFSGRKSEVDADEDAEIRSCVVEPGTPHASMPELCTLQIHQIGGPRYETLQSNMNSTFSHIPISPALPQRAPILLDQWGRADDGSQPLMNAVELEEGYTWNRYPRMPELNPTPSSTYMKQAYSRPAELDSSHAGHPKAAHLIPRKQVGSHAQLAQSATYLGPT